MHIHENGDWLAKNDAQPNHRVADLAPHEGQGSDGTQRHLEGGRGRRRGGMRDCSQLKLIFLQLQMSMNHSKMQVDHCATIMLHFCQ